MPAHRATATGLRPRTTEDGGVSRRRFLGYLIAAPTLVVAAEMGRQTVFGAPEASAAPIPSVQTTELYDLSDAIRDAARPTANLIKIEVNRDGTVSFAMPRSDNGQGIITSTQMIIAEEMDLELDQVVVTLADARPELVFNQLTGGSSAMFTLYTPVRVAAALARGRLLDAAAAAFDQDAGTLSSRAGVITSLTGGTLGIGELAEKAAVQTTEQVEVVLKPREEFRILGTPQTKTDARAIVTGKKQFATDLQIPDALPAVVCRAPDLNGAPSSIDNIDEIRSMPGVTDVEVIATGVAVRAVTFGHCIDAVRAMTVQWEPGTVAGEDDESVLAGLRAAELPLAVPPAGGTTVEGDFTFYFKSNSSLETNCAIADVRSDSAELWFPTKTPITGQDQIATLLGMPVNAVTVHVTEGGGSFGRKLFLDAALEAAEFSQKIGKPVKLMWTRSDDSRQGRVHPMATSRVRASVTADSVLSFELRHTSVSMDVSHGFGDALTVAASRLPAGNLAVAEVIWELSQTVPYNFGVSTRLLNEVDMRFNTGPMRNVYSPDSTVARELMVDQIAAKMDRDPYEFRREFLKHDRQRAVLDKVAEEGNWGRSMEEGTAQGISFQTEYKSVIAALVEIDCRPETVNRSVREGLTGPRVTKVTIAVDVGVVINPRGIEAQILGAINDALAMTLTGSMSLVDGHFVEASWDNYFYTRQWNTPPEVNFHLVESDAPEPGGVGELGVGGATGAIACAYARATGKVPEYFPIMHKEPRPFEPYPTVPPIPPSPTNGLDTTF